MFGKVYIYLSTHPLTWSQIYPPSHKCHINIPFSRFRYQVKKTLKSHANSLSAAIRLCPYPQKQIACSADLRRLCEPSAFKSVQNLFTTISSKTCTEHVRNLSSAVPSPVCIWAQLSQLPAQSLIESPSTLNAHRWCTCSFFISLKNRISIVLNKHSTQHNQNTTIDKPPRYSLGS